MNKITNIKVNYIILEQILRVTGVYTTLCDEHEFLEVIIKHAKTGKLDDLLKDDNIQKTAFDFLEHITGLPEKYWNGSEKIELGIRLKNKGLSYDGESLDTVDLDNDNPFFDRINKVNYPYGILYPEQLKNPLHLDYEETYCKAHNKKDASDNELDEAITIVETLYSLKGLLTVMLINMANEIELIDKANVYKHTKWEPYIDILSEPTKHGITYSPKFIEIQEGLVQTIIRSIYKLGIVFPLRDLDKEFIVKF